MIVALVVGTTLTLVSLWAITRSTPQEPPRLHPYTVRKLCERQYRFFDDDQWAPWEPNRMDP